MNSNLTSEELLAGEQEANQLLSKINSMSGKELLADIIRHEKEVRGIDWSQLASDQSLSTDQVREKANGLAKIYLRNLQAELELADEDLPDFTRDFLKKPYSASNVQVAPTWGLNEKEAGHWKDASGEKLKDMISYRLKVMQSLELTSGVTIYGHIMLSIGVVAWMKRAYDFYKIARAAGMLRMAAVCNAIQKVTLNATRMFVATAIVAIIADILLYLMEKDAVVYMVLINMTDDDLIKNDQYLTHGKQTVQFVRLNDEEKEEDILSKRTVMTFEDGSKEENYWIGIYAAQKNNMALVGSQGAFSFQPCQTFPQGAYVGWEIPLSGVFGGPNRCLVAAARRSGNLEEFSNIAHKHGSLFCEDRFEKAKVTSKMHSGSGSEGYMSVIFETVA
jgi:hypothetical protein